MERGIGKILRGEGVGGGVGGDEGGESMGKEATAESKAPGDEILGMRKRGRSSPGGGGRPSETDVRGAREAVRILIGSGEDVCEVADVPALSSPATPRPRERPESSKEASRRRGEG